MPRIFVCYSRKDLRWMRTPAQAPESALLPWLRDKMKRSGIEIWWDEQLNKRIGEAYDAHICEAILSCETAILLLSDDFFMSDYIAEHELPLIRQRVENGQMQLFPIVVTHVDWGHSDDARWVKRRQIHPAAVSPLIEIVQSEAVWKRVRSELSVALREQVQGFVPKIFEQTARGGSVLEGTEKPSDQTGSRIEIPPHSSAAATTGGSGPAASRPRSSKKHAYRSRWTDLGGGVLEDNLTGLHWTKHDNGDDVSWHDAKQYCEQLDDGWRLPTLDELTSVYSPDVDLIQAGGWKVRVSRLFRLSGIFYWSDSLEEKKKPAPKSPWPFPSHISHKEESAWGVNLYYGRQSADRVSAAYGARVLCVRHP